MANKSHTTNPTKNTITRRNILKSTGALFGAMAIGIGGKVFSKPAFDPSRFIRECGAYGVYFCTWGNQLWINVEYATEAGWDLLTEMNKVPDGKKQIADYLIDIERTIS